MVHVEKVAVPSRPGSDEWVVAWVAFVAGIAASLAANIAHADVSLGAKAIAGWAPLALLLCAEVAASSAFDSADRLVKSFRQTEVALERLRSKLRTLEPAIAGLEAALQSAVGVDDDTRDKAQRWDEIQKLLGR